ncbi:MAG: hypothetical protein K2O59_12730 [Lachnospiraceae bacterium]|nr:hypothetical protein [Lachnospiraceae bacterium]
MKKKNLVAKGMAMLMACALVIGNTGITAHAYVADDGTVHSDREAGGSSASDGSDNIGGGSSSSGGSNSGGGSSSSYDDGCARSDREAGGSSASDGSDNIGGSSTASAPKAAGTEASAGKEKFRATANAGAGTYKVTHKGIDIATFKLMDADKKNVSCTKVTLKQRDDKKYAIDFQVADAKGLTVGAPLDRTYMYNTLGVSYVTINDTVVIDIEAEAQAAAAK